MILEDKVASHYERGDIAVRILKAAHDAGYNMEKLKAENLSKFDHYHVGGVRATAYFAGKLSIVSYFDVLDIGGGIGGPARYIASKTSAKVTSLDVTPSFTEANRVLTAETNLQKKVKAVTGSALSMPFKDDRFDVAYMMHVGMNIKDKETLFAEARRVIKDNGAFGIYDIFKTKPDTELIYPVPWADTPDTSFVTTVHETSAMLEQAGFNVRLIENRKAAALTHLGKLSQMRAAPSPCLADTKDEDAARPPQKVTHLHDNLKAGLCAPYIIVCR